MRRECIKLEEKEYLSIVEACRLWDLSDMKLRKFLNAGPYDFLAYYGKRKLIIRAVFDKYLNDHPELKEELTHGPSTKRFKAQSPAPR